MSRRRAPEVVTGMTSPVNRSGVDASERAKAQLQEQIEAAQRTAKPYKSGEAVFQSRFHGYRYQISAPADVYNPATGEVTKGRPKAAQFTQGEFRTSDPEVIARLRRAPEFGIGRDFWDAEEMRQISLDKSVASLAETVKNSGDPALIQRLIDELTPLAGQSKTFNLPAVNPASVPSEDEIASALASASAQAAGV